MPMPVSDRDGRIWAATVGRKDRRLSFQSFQQACTSTPVGAKRGFRQQGLPKPPSGLPALQWARHSQPAGLLSKNGAPTPYPPPKEGARGRELPNHVLLSEARSAKSKHHRIRNKVILRLRLTPPLSMTNLNDPPSVTAAPCHPPPTGVGLGGYDGIRKPRGDEKIVRLEERLSGNSSKIVE